MVAKRQRPDECERARRLINDAVPRHVNAWAEIVGLAPTDPCFNQFREDVTSALHACMQEHIAGFAKEIRKEVREEFLARYRRRITAIKELRDTFAVRWPPSYHEFQVWEDLRPILAKLETMAEAMRLEADDRKGRRGRPPMAFRALAVGLVLAYQRSTGETGVGHGAREGKLLAFVESILPIVSEIATAVTGKPLETSEAIGEYLHRVAQRD
jgi:hypothetical protein